MTQTPLLDNVLLFIQMLRRAGVRVSSEQAAEFSLALSLIDIGNRNQFYHAARGLLLDRYEHLPLFDTLFNRFWRLHAPPAHTPKAPPAARSKSKRRPQFNVVNYMAYKARFIDQDIDIDDKAATFSSVELLQRKQFSQMTDEELETVKQIMQQMRWPAISRKTRRWQVDNSGKRLELRKTLRTAVKYGGVPLQLARRSRKVKQRPIVLLADISGSMEKYARLLLQFFYSVTHSFSTVEAFLFGTRLTHITPQLKLKNIDRAVAAAAAEVVDFAGGTRIGESIQRFNRQYSKRVLRGGSIVLIVSDGWERGDVSQLADGMRYLQHRCHRLFWLNPLLGEQGYQPLVEGMAAALPYVDSFLPIHNLQSLEQLAQKLAQIGNHTVRTRV